MKRIAMVAALVAIAACNKGDKSIATDSTSTTTSTTTTVAPTTDSAGGSMSSGSSMDTTKMSGSNMDTTKMSGAMSGDSASGTKNQTQSGMTDSAGKSTLGPNATKLSPTSGAAVTAKGDTLKKKTSTPQ